MCCCCHFAGPMVWPWSVLHDPNTACVKLVNKGNPGVGDNNESEVIVKGESQNQHPSTATTARESR